MILTRKYKHLNVLRFDHNQSMKLTSIEEIEFPKYLDRNVIPF